MEGKVKTRSYEDKEGVKKYVTEIIAENVNLLDKKRGIEISKVRILYCRIENEIQ